MRLPWRVIVPVVCVVAACGVALVRQVHNRGVEKRLVEDARACHVRAEQGDAFSQYTLALMYHHGKGLPQDYGAALRWYRKAADQGNVKAQYALGYMNYVGEGIPQNFNEAFNWYRKAADQGDGKAEYALGLSFYDGRGVPQDFVESAHWYRKAAEQGIAQAQYSLGYMLYYGQGVAQDRAEADQLFHKAAGQGDEDALKMLGIRRPTWTSTRLVFVLVETIGGVLILISVMLRDRSKIHRKGTAAAVGILCLFSAGLSFWVTNDTGAFRSRDAFIAFSLSKWFLDGALIVLLAYLIFSRKKSTSGGTLPSS